LEYEVVTFQVQCYTKNTRTMTICISEGEGKGIPALN